MPIIAVISMVLDISAYFPIELLPYRRSNNIQPGYQPNAWEQAREETPSTSKSLLCASAIQIIVPNTALTTAHMSKLLCVEMLMTARR
jgi:hypothetical protein